MTKKGINTMNRSLKVPADILADEVGWMAKLKAGPGINPVTSAVQVRTVLGALELRRTDFDQFRTSTVPAEGAGQAMVTVAADKLTALLKGATGMAILDIAEDKLSIEWGGRTVALRAVDTELPAWPDFAPTGEPAVVGVNQVARVLTSVGTDPTLPMLTGVRFEDGVMVTTDRYRLTRITYGESGFTALVPGEPLRAFARGPTIINVEPGMRTGTNDEPLVRLTSGGRSIIVPMTDGEFPKWRSLIPADDPPVRTLLRRDDLLNAAGGDQVTLTVTDDQTMLVHSSDRDGDVEVTQKLSLTVLNGDGLPFTVVLSTKYLTACLRSIDCGAVRFEASAPDKPVALGDVGNGDLHLLMPIRVGNSP